MPEGFHGRRDLRVGVQHQCRNEVGRRPEEATVQRLQRALHADVEECAEAGGAPRVDVGPQSLLGVAEVDGATAAVSAAAGAHWGASVGVVDLSGLRSSWWFERFLLSLVKRLQIGERLALLGGLSAPSGGLRAVPTFGPNVQWSGESCDRVLCVVRTCIQAGTFASDLKELCMHMCACVSARVHACVCVFVSVPIPPIPPRRQGLRPQTFSRLIACLATDYHYYYYYYYYYYY